MNMIARWSIGLLASLALSVANWGCAAADADPVELGELESSMVVPQYPHGYDQNTVATRTCDRTSPGTPACVFPATKVVRVCVDTTGMSAAESSLGAPVLVGVLSKLNARMATSGFGNGYTYTGVQCNASPNVVFRKTTFTSSLINRYVTIGCDTALAAIPFGNGTARECTKFGGYINYANLAADFGAPVLGQVNGPWALALERFFGHVLVAGATGVGSQVVNNTFYSWGGTPICGGAPPTAAPCGLNPAIGSVASRERCRAQVYDATNPAAFFVSGTVCPVL